MLTILAVTDATLIWLAVIGGIPSTLAAIAGLLSIMVSLRNGRRLAQVKIQTDGLVEDLVKKSEAKGNLQGGVDERARADARDALR